MGIMYATYCLGVCGADCDGPNYNGNDFGNNQLFPILIAHDFCQAYIGSVDSATKNDGVRNGCGDEVYARQYAETDIWLTPGGGDKSGNCCYSSKSQGTKAAQLSNRSGPGSCDMGA